MRSTSATAAALTKIAQGQDAVLSALPFFLNPGVAQVCADVGAHYFDLTEDVETTRAVKAIAKSSKVAFAPQCGLAPGFISIVANQLTKGFDALRDVHMRVGALPEFPANALKYNLTWSTDGLINEYCNPCEAIHEGKLTEVMPMEGLEHFSLDGIDYECFNTSGGLGTLCETLDGKLESLNYKTVRYPGHCDIMKMLLEDLRLKERRGLLKDILETSVPITHQDVVLIFVVVTGMRDGRLTQESYAKKIYAQAIGGKLMSAIQITTAAGITRDGGPVLRRQAAAAGLHPPGAVRPGRLPGEPVRALLCRNCAEPATSGNSGSAVTGVTPPARTTLIQPSTQRQVIWMRRFPCRVSRCWLAQRRWLLRFRLRRPWPDRLLRRPVSRAIPAACRPFHRSTATSRRSRSSM